MPHSEAVESGMARVSKAKESEVVDEDANVVLNRSARFDVASASRATGSDGTEFGALPGHVPLFNRVDDTNDFIQNCSISSGDLRDAERMVGATTGTSFEGEGFITNILDGVPDRIDLDVSNDVDTSEKSLRPVTIFL